MMPAPGVCAAIIFLMENLIGFSIVKTTLYIRLSLQLFQPGQELYADKDYLETGFLNWSNLHLSIQKAGSKNSTGNGVINPAGIYFYQEDIISLTMFLSFQNCRMPDQFFSWYARSN